MRLRTLSLRTMALLLAAMLVVCDASGQAQKKPQKKPAAAKSKSAARRSKSPKRSRRRDRGQKAPTPERISEIQQALSKDGSFTGTPNGKLDDTTVESLKKFQESHGLNPTGKLTASTLQQLGLGSPIAGVAPPLPPLGASAATRTPSSAVPPRP